MHPALHITRGQVLGAGALALVALGLSLLVPAPAHALELDPPPSVEEVLKAIVDELFKVKPTELNGEFLRWLIAVPNFVGDPANGTLDGDLGGLGRTSTAIAFGLLSAVMTWAVVHYWLAGISFFRGEGTDLLEGITRGVGAALLIIGWPLIFTNAVALTNSISNVLVDGPGLDRLGTMLTAAMGSDQLFQEGVGMIFGIVISIAMIVMVLGLGVTKIVVSVILGVLFVFGPIAFVLRPVTWLAFLAEATIRLCAGLLALQIVWAVCMATFLAVGQKILEWGTRGSAFHDAVAKPFVALALLSTMMMVTRLLLRLNLSSGGGMGMGGGGMGHMAAPLAGVVSSVAHSQGTGPAGTGSGAGDETATQPRTDSSETVNKSSMERQSTGGAPAGSPSSGVGAASHASTATQAGGTPAAAPGTGAGAASNTAAASAKATGAAANGAKAGEGNGATSGAAGGRAGASEQAAGAPGAAEQAAAASKSAQGDAANQRSVRGPDEQPATAAGASSSSVGEQPSEGAARSASPSESAAPAAAPGTQPGGAGSGAGGGGGAGAGGDGGAGTGERGGASDSGSPAAASPASGGQPATQPSGSGAGAGGPGGPGGDGNEAGSPAPGGGEAASQPAASTNGGGEAASQPGASTNGGGSGRQPGAAPGGAPGSSAPANGSADSGSAGGGESPLSYDWVAGEFRPSSQSSADPGEGSDSAPAEDDDIADVPYTGILEAGDGERPDEGGS